MSAAILMLITLSQLMLTPSASILKNELYTFMAQDGNRTEMATSGEFVRPPKLVDTTIIKNKLHELQNNVNKLAEDILNKNQNVDDIKNVISAMEKEIENLNKLYDDKDREISLTQTKFQNIISDLLAKYINREQEIAKLKYEEAIDHRYYQFAAVKFVTIENETSAENLVRSVYEEIGDLPSMLEFADHVNDLERKLLIYRAIANSNSFRYCLNCNIILTCKKLLEVLDSNKITGELEKTISNTLNLFNAIIRKNLFGFCIRNSMKEDPETVKFFVERFCLSGLQFGILAKSGIHDYSGYCYPINSIYSLLQ
uniref:Uncharacterized protein n=1 Tax=Rhodnius prolixus TaxID=13249 RepID=A0A4P6D7R4_RHOPR